MSNTALIIGATGLVGEQCLKKLLASNAYTSVIVLTRTQPKTQNPEMLTPWSASRQQQSCSSGLRTIIADFDKLESYKQEIKADDIYCAIGTTIAKAGSQAAFRKVDYEIPLKVAALALSNGAKKFILVSALGAKAGSGIFYNRVKGELEEALKKLNFGSLIIFRPSLLLGDRKEKRTGEAIGRFLTEKFSFLFAGPLKRYKGTPVDLLAKKMVELGTEENQGVRIVENEEIIS